MVPPAIVPLLWSCLWAAPAAALAGPLLPVAAIWAALGLLLSRCAWLPHRRAGLLALPALLAGVAPPLQPAPPLPLGPVQLRGEVSAIVRTPTLDQVHVWLRRGAAPPLRMALDGDLPALPGDRLRILARILPGPCPDLPPSVHAIAATARLEPGPPSLSRLAAAARRRLEQNLLQQLGAEPGALVASLVLGRGTRPPADLVQAHRATGLSHLLAVSGAHAAMLAVLLGLQGWRRARRLAAGPRRTTLVLLVLFAYAAITGNEPPVLRAVVAFALSALAAHQGRPFPLATGLLVPALVTCLLQPTALLGPSFLLSYAAVIGLMLASRAFDDGGAAARWLWAPLRASAWATLLTAPLTLCFFGQLAPWTVLLTPLLAPLVGAMLVGGLLLAALAEPLPRLVPALLTGPLELLANAYTALVQAADHLPGTPVHATSTPPPWALGLMALAGLLLVLWRPTRARLATAALLLCAPHFVAFGAPASDRLQLFAVGHGQAALVTTGSGHQTAIDCGSLQRPFLAAERLLAALPRKHLDLLVITHADVDHHNGVQHLLERVPIARALLPQALHGSALEAMLQGAGTEVAILAPGSASRPAPHLAVHAPSLPDGASDNDQSLWVSAALGPRQLLMTGDAQELGTAAAIAAGVATPHDLLVLPHHGRPNVNALRLLQQVRPRACLASAASADGDTALGKLVQRFGARLLVTGQDGSITFDGATQRLGGDAPGRALPPGP
jgi:competence protein ComEC